MNSELNALFSFEFDYPFKHIKKQYITDMKRIYNAKGKEKKNILNKFMQRKKPVDSDYCILLTFVLSIDYSETNESELRQYLTFVRPLANRKYSPANIGLIGFYIKLSESLDMLDAVVGLFSNYPLEKVDDFQLFYRFYYYQMMRLHLNNMDLEGADYMCRRGLAITLKPKQVQSFLGFGIVICWFKGKFFKEEFLHTYLPMNHCIRVMNFYIKHLEYKNALLLLQSHAEEFNHYGLYLVLVYHLKYICLVQVLNRLCAKFKGQEKFQYSHVQQLWPDCFEPLELTHSLTYLFGGHIMKGYIMEESKEFILESVTVNHYILPDFSTTLDKEPSECLQKMLLLKEPDIFPCQDLENEFLKEIQVGFE